MRRKLSNYAAKLRQIFTKSAVIVRHFRLTFGSNWQQLCINNVVGRVDQTPEHQKQQKPETSPCLAEGFGIFVKFELTDEESTAVRFVQAYVKLKVSRDWITS